MKRSKVLLGFIKYSVPEKIAFYRNVLSKMRINVATFANPDADLNNAEALVEALEAKYLASKDGGRSTTLALRTAEAAADAVFKTLAAYVDRIANGDESIILLAGFNASKPSNPIQKSEIKAEDGPHSKSVKLLAKAIDNAGAYIWQIAKNAIPTDDKGWEITGYSTQVTYIVDDLTVGEICYFRMAAITPDGVTDFTAPIMKVVV